MLSNLRTTAATARRNELGHALLVACCLAVGVPALLAFNVPPSSTLLNQASALVGWGGMVVLIVLTLDAHAPRRNAGLICVLAAFGVMTAAALATPLWTGQPWGLALSNAGMLAITIVLILAGAAAHSVGEETRLFRVFCWSLLVVGVLSVIVGIVQVFMPEAVDGDVIARSGEVGRAVGNLRQPNHLSSLLLWSAIAVVWLAEGAALRRGPAAVLYVFVVFGVVLSASRTGVVGIVLLALWGALDRRLVRFSRVLLMLSPIIYAIAWLGLAIWARVSEHVFGGEVRLTTEGAASGSRLAAWDNTLQLIAQHPWTGVGFGEFNFAWTLTPFPNRPREFFDHTHNLPLHLIVELGIPLAILVMALITFAVWRAFAASRAALGFEGTTLRAAFIMVLMMALHSQLEYPLWYAYFLLPTALAFGLCLGRMPGAEAAAIKAERGRTRPLLVAGLLVMFAGFAVVFDYKRVVAIFEPPENALPLAERIAYGQRSLFFAHHADYAAATTAEHPSQVMDTFSQAPHYLLDARLMMAWANALHESGDIDRARYIARRLAEFHHPLADEFFAPCRASAPMATAKPFQCEDARVPFTFDDFRH